MKVYTASSLLDMAAAPEALLELLVQTPGQASLMQEVTPAERSWSSARSAARYRVTKTLGRDFFSCSTPASVTFVPRRSRYRNSVSPFRCSRSAPVAAIPGPYARAGRLPRHFAGALTVLQRSPTTMLSAAWR